jgi:hypothetical protein
MNCSTFKKKLSDYMEDNVQYDMKKAMDKHLEECIECKNIYEQEEHLDDLFRSAFDVDNMKFSSSRSIIMRSVDRNKYSDSLASKIRLHIKKYQKKYLSCAAILVILLISSPLLSRYSRNDLFSLGHAKKEAIMENASQSKSEVSDTRIGDNNGMSYGNTALKAEDKVSGEDTKKITASDTQKPTYIPTFKRIKSEMDPEKGMATAMKQSPDGKLQAQLDGRGVSAGDEGVADIFIINEKSEKWRLQLVDNDINFTPMYLEWMDSENVLVTMGLSSGHATYGGSVYAVNINTGKAFLVYEVDSDKEQVASIKKLDNGIKFLVKVFIDDTKNQTRDEERIINFTTVTEKTTKPVSILYEYAMAINNKKINEAVGKLTSDSRKNYVAEVGDIENINSINIIKVIDVTSSSLIDENLSKYADVKIYYIQAEYNMSNPTIKSQGNEILYQKVVAVKEKSNSEWLIKNIQIVNQSSAN